MPRSSRRHTWLWLGLILALTAALALAWSGNKLLNQDEVFVLQTDSVRSVAQLLHIQLHTPISLDPPVYHLLAHAATRVFGPTPFALRLPSLAGFLLMQLCLFLYVARAASDRAALLAAALPALTATLFYAAEARPYGLLLGFFTLTLVAYQSSTRNSDASQIHTSPPASRAAALVVLAIAIALTLNTHYFGILLLVPLYAAELARTFARRTLDLPLVFAILAGTLTFAFTLPFQHAATAFRVHYYNLASASPHAITQAYRSLFVDYTRTSLRTQHIAAILFVLVTFCFLAALAVRWKSFHLPPGEAVFLLTLAALPFFGYLLAHFVTHTIEVRYVLGALIAIAVLVSLLTAPLLERAPNLILAFVLVAMAVTGELRIRAEARKTAGILASLRIPLPLEAILRADPARRLYIQEVGPFEEARYNTPDPELRARIALVYSSDQEIRINGHDTEALTAEHLAQFSDVPIVPYDQLLADPSAHILVLFPVNGWQWIDRASAEDHATTIPIASWYDGTAVAATFPPHPAP